MHFTSSACRERFKRVLGRRDSPYFVADAQELEFAQAQQKKNVQDAMYNYGPVVAKLRVDLTRGRIKAAKARGKYDRAEWAVRKLMRREAKVRFSLSAFVDYTARLISVSNMPILFAPLSMRS